MLGFPLLYFKGMRLMMFQLSSFYCSQLHVCSPTDIALSTSLNRFARLVPRWWQGWCACHRTAQNVCPPCFGAGPVKLMAQRLNIPQFTEHALNLIRRLI